MVVSAGDAGLEVAELVIGVQAGECEGHGGLQQTGAEEPGSRLLGHLGLVPSERLEGAGHPLRHGHGRGSGGDVRLTLMIVPPCGGHRVDPAEELHQFDDPLLGDRTLFERPEEDLTFVVQEHLGPSGFARLLADLDENIAQVFGLIA